MIEQVLEDRILVQAPKYRLNVALPHKVRSGQKEEEEEQEDIDTRSTMNRVMNKCHELE